VQVAVIDDADFSSHKNARFSAGIFYVSGDGGDSNTVTCAKPYYFCAHSPLIKFVFTKANCFHI
jgi:hypothetical protein